MQATPTTEGPVWAPLPGSQELALACPASHILYEGSRGPGKTDAQLMFFRKHVGLGYGKFWRGIIFDREYKMLDDLVSKSLRWFPQFEDGARFLSSGKDYKWVWSTGEELMFRAVSREEDYWNYHGQEFPFIGWNELTKYPTPTLYDMMMSCNRSSFRPDLHCRDRKLPEIPLVVFSTTNPYGSGHNWVKHRFIDTAQPGELLRREVEVFNPRTQKRQVVTRTQCRLFGSYRENTFLSPEYVAELELTKEPNKRKAWLEGDWNIVAGGALDDLWREEVHVVAPFRIPEEWHIDRSFDWGSSKPFSVGFWAEANGEEITLNDGSKWAPVAGSLFRVAEIYGTRELGLNEGVKMGAREVARRIKHFEAELVENRWLPRLPDPGPADNAIRNVEERESDSIAAKMEEEGVSWESSDKRPGSRKNGLQLLRDRLEASCNGEGPGIYFFSNCKATLATVPVLPRSAKDPDDVDTEAEDHAYDDIRYRVLKAGNRVATGLRSSYAS